jgi:hypothetical protein
VGSCDRLAGLVLASMGALACSGLAFTACRTDNTGAACTSNDDCGGEDACVYRIADGCGARPTCQKKPTGPLCHSIVLYCGCDGATVPVACGTPSGYAPAPVGGLLQGTVNDARCAPGGDAGAD